MMCRREGPLLDSLILTGGMTVTHPAALPGSSMCLLPHVWSATRSISVTWVLSEMQNPRPHSRLTESESAF